MKINGKEIADHIINHLSKEVKKLKRKPAFAVFLVKPSEENISFVKAKEKATKAINGSFHLIRTNTVPTFEKFANNSLRARAVFFRNSSRFRAFVLSRNSSVCTTFHGRYAFVERTSPLLCFNIRLSTLSVIPI